METNEPLIDEVIKIATKWTELQYTIANTEAPQDQNAQKDAQARIELVDHIRQVYRR
jgi:hypothetical protein